MGGPQSKKYFEILQLKSMDEWSWKVTIDSHQFQGKIFIIRTVRFYVIWKTKFFNQFFFQNWDNFVQLDELDDWTKPVVHWCMK